MGAGAQHLAILRCFPRTRRELDRNQPELEPAPTWEAGIAGGDVTRHATALVPESALNPFPMTFVECPATLSWAFWF